MEDAPAARPHAGPRLRRRPGLRSGSYPRERTASGACSAPTTACSCAGWRCRTTPPSASRTTPAWRCGCRPGQAHLGVARAAPAAAADGGRLRPRPAARDARDERPSTPSTRTSRTGTCGCWASTRSARARGWAAGCWPRSSSAATPSACPPTSRRPPRAAARSTCATASRTAGSCACRRRAAAVADVAGAGRMMRPPPRRHLRRAGGRRRRRRARLGARRRQRPRRRRRRLTARAPAVQLARLLHERRARPAPGCARCALRSRRRPISRRTFYGADPLVSLWGLSCDGARVDGKRTGPVVLSLVAVPTGLTDPRAVPLANNFAHRLVRIDSELADARARPAPARRCPPNWRGARAAHSGRVVVPGQYDLTRARRRARPAPRPRQPLRAPRRAAAARACARASDGRRRRPLLLPRRRRLLGLARAPRRARRSRGCSAALRRPVLAAFDHRRIARLDLPLRTRRTGG